MRGASRSAERIGLMVRNSRPYVIPGLAPHFGLNRGSDPVFTPRPVPEARSLVEKVTHARSRLPAIERYSFHGSENYPGVERRP